MKDGGTGALEAGQALPQLHLNPAVAAAAEQGAISTPAPAMEPQGGGGSHHHHHQAVKRNTKNLGLRLGADLISAASAAVLVAPVISIIDR